MTEATNPAEFKVTRQLALTEAMLLPAAFREPVPPKPAPHRFSARLLLALGVAVVLIGAAGAYGRQYWTVGRFLQSTDDAYVEADSTIVAPEVSGYLSGVLVADNQPVKAGQPLAKIDDRDYVAALDQAKADVATAQSDIANVTAAEQQVAMLQAQLAKANAALQRSQAAQQQAQLNLGFTDIVAPIDGVVGNRSLRIGQFVQAGTQLMAVVPLAAVYVVANFEETQLADIRAGEPVDIVVDTYSGATVKGHVDSVAPTSGQEFALLPPDNATGNFTKIVQRVPVKIAIDANDPLRGNLRPGMSVTATIDTRTSVDAKTVVDSKPSAPDESAARPAAVH
jgi:membrane fusion protein (multidrug efflux system)